MEHIHYMTLVWGVTILVDRRPAIPYSHLCTLTIVHVDLSWRNEAVRARLKRLGLYQEGYEPKPKHPLNLSPSEGQPDYLTFLRAVLSS